MGCLLINQYGYSIEECQGIVKGYISRIYCYPNDNRRIYQVSLVIENDSHSGAKVIADSSGDQVFA
jgi:hypothetical protein